MEAAVQVFANTTGVNEYALSFIIPIGEVLRRPVIRKPACTQHSP